MNKSYLVIFWLVVSTNTSADDMSVGDYMANRSKPATIEYVAGIGEGMEFLNYRAATLGRDPVFCVPKNLKLNAGNYMNIVETELARDNKKNRVLMPLVSVMADGFVRTFPCK